MAIIVNGILVRDGKVLMAHRSAHRKTYANTWSFPGGHVETGETHLEALHRELREEIGVAPGSAKHVAQFQDGADGPVFHLFRVDDWTGTPSNKGHEHSALRWFPLFEAAELRALAFPMYSPLLQRLSSE